MVPVGNYGTAHGGPDGERAVSPTAATHGFTLSGIPLTVNPESEGQVTLAFTPTATQSGAASNATPFTLTTTDTTATHPTKVSAFASVGSYEFVLVLDMSGSMGYDGDGNNPNPPTDPSRWSLLQDAATTVLQHIGNFASTSGYYGAVVYPAPNPSNAPNPPNAQVIPGAGHKNPTSASPNPTISTGASITWTGLTPTNGTPMAGTGTSPGVTANLGGIYMAMGDPGGSPSGDCGLFIANTSAAADAAAFANNHRWMILMSDGASNIGDDPSTLPASYYNDRHVQAITVAFGVPGAGQVDVAPLQAVATNSTGIALGSPNSTYLGANPDGSPSDNLPSVFMKATTRGLGLSFGSDPSAVLAVGAPPNRHRVVVTEYDTKASFFVCCSDFEQGKALAVELITPAGEVVTPTTAASFGLTYSATQLSRTYFAGPSALAPQGATARYGTWTLVVGSTAGNAPTVNITVAPSAVASRIALAYAYQLIVDSGLSLYLGSGAGAHYAGDPITVDAYLTAHGRPISGAQVSVQVSGSGLGFDNWLAAQPLTAAEDAAALAALGTMHDYRSQFVKARALQAKGITYPGGTTSAGQPLTYVPKAGTYQASFGSTDQPATFQFLVTATGQDSLGNLYQRQQTETIVIRVQPTEASTIVEITYQVVGAQMQATMRFWPKDDFGNVFLVDPTISQAVKVLLQGGASLSGPLKDNYDGSYTQLFTYPVAATPIVTIEILGNAVVPKLLLPNFGGMLFVDQVVSYTKGREAKAGINAHTDATQALGDPSKRPLTSFVSLGGLGSGTFDVKGKTIQAREVTVFVIPDTSLRAYAVDVLPVQAGVGWVEVGRSVGVTQTFSLVPGSGGCRPNPRGSYIEVEVGESSARPSTSRSRSRASSTRPFHP